MTMNGQTMIMHFVNIKGTTLNRYYCATGGGMRGGYHQEEVVPKGNGHAVIRITRADWHNEKPEVEEYIVDAQVLSELEQVIRKYHINFWHKRKFTTMFVCDGESTSYSFRFGTKYISFSSQIYPPRVRGKLKEFDEILTKYIEKAIENPAE